MANILQHTPKNNILVTYNFKYPTKTKIKCLPAKT